MRGSGSPRRDAETRGLFAVEEDTEPSSDQASTASGSEADQLDYIASLVLEMRDMARTLPQTSLHAILDAALTEARLQMARRRA